MREQTSQNDTVTVGPGPLLKYRRIMIVCLVVLVVPVVLQLCNLQTKRMERASFDRDLKMKVLFNVAADVDPEFAFNFELDNMCVTKTPDNLYVVGGHFERAASSVETGQIFEGTFRYEVNIKGDGTVEKIKSTRGWLTKPAW